MTKQLEEKYGGYKQLLAKGGHIIFPQESYLPRKEHLLERASKVTKNINLALVLLNKLQRKGSKILVVYGQRLERGDLYYRPKKVFWGTIPLKPGTLGKDTNIISENSQGYPMLEGLGFGALSNWQGLKAKAIRNLFLLSDRDKRFLKSLSSFRGLLIPENSHGGGARGETFDSLGGSKKNPRKDPKRDLIRSLFRPVSQKGQSWSVSWAYERKPDAVLLINPDRSTLDEVGANNIPFFVLGTVARPKKSQGLFLSINSQSNHMAEELLYGALAPFYRL